MKYVLLWMIRFYRKYLSGMKALVSIIQPAHSMGWKQSRSTEHSREGLWRYGESCAVIHFQKVDMIRYLKEDK